MRFELFVGAFSAFGLVGCGFYAPHLGEAIPIACTRDADCPAERAFCVAEVCREDPPTTALDLEMREAVLAGNADTTFRIVLDGEDAPRAALLTRIGDVDFPWAADDTTHTWTVPSDDVLSGDYTVLTVVDEQKRPLTELTLDRTPPDVIDVASDASLLGGGARATFAVTVSEALDMDGMSARLVGAVDLACEVSPLDASGLRFSVQSPLGSPLDPGPYALHIDLRDVLGNEAVFIKQDALAVDAAPPALVGFEIAAALLRPGETLSLSAQFDEPLTGAPELVLEGLGPGIMVLGSIDGATVSFSVPVPNTASGEYALRIEQVRDGAGNAADAVVLDTIVHIDATLPTVENYVASATALLPSDVLRVSFDASETLAMAPVVRTYVAGVPLPFVPADPGLDATYAFELVLADSGLSGTHVVEVELTDEAGWTAFIVAGSFEVDASPPSAAVSGFLPAAARLGTTVSLVITPSEPLSAPPVLTFEPEDPGFVVATEQTGAAYLATFEVVEGTPSGAFGLVSVGLTDLAGNVATVVVDEALTIDSVAPVVGVVGLNDSLWGDVPSRDAVVATFDTDENLDLGGSLSVGLGSTAMTCGAYAATSPNYTCTGTIHYPDVATLPFVLLTIAAADAAGNQNNDSVTVLPVDNLAPDVVHPATTLTLTSNFNTGGLEDLVYLGTHIQLTVQVTEELAGFPVVTSSPPGLSFSVERTTPLFYVLQTTFSDSTLPQGPYALSMELEDEVGHEVHVPLQLPQPGLTVQTRVDSPCVAHNAGGEPLPTDYDGDGVFGFGPGCPDQASCPDCNDSDPLVYPNAHEIANDGTPNGCHESPDLRADKDPNGLYLDAGAPPGGDGSRELPFNQLDEALHVVGSAMTLYIAGGVYVGMPGVIELENVSLHGGFDPVGWTPSTTASVINTGVGGLIIESNGTKERIVRDIHFGPNVMLWSREGTVSVSQCAFAPSAPEVDLFRSRLIFVHNEIDARTQNYVAADYVLIAENQVSNGASLGLVNGGEEEPALFLRNRFDAASIYLTDYAARASIVNNVIRGPTGGGAAISVWEGVRQAQVVGNSFIANGGSSAMLVTFATPPNDATFFHWVNNAFYSSDSTTEYVYLADGASPNWQFFFHGNAFGATAEYIFSGEFDVDTYTASAGAANFNGSCGNLSTDSCRKASGNIMASLPDPGGTTITVAPNSPLVGLAQNPWDDPLLERLSTAYAGDIDGTCRKFEHLTAGAVAPLPE